MSLYRIMGAVYIFSKFLDTFHDYLLITQGTVKGPQYFIGKGELCVAVATICKMGCVCSLLSIAAVAVNRCVFLCHHFSYWNIFSWRKTFVICCLLWTAAALIELPNHLGWGGHSFDLKVMSCSYDRRESSSYNWYLTAFAFVFPTIAIFTSYFRIYIRVRAMRMELSRISGRGSLDDISAKRKENEIKLARTLFIVFVIFVVCWAPYISVVVIDSDDHLPIGVYAITFQIAHMSSSLNCIIYGATNRSFRNGYKQLVFKVCSLCRRQSRHSQMSNLPSISYISSLSQRGSGDG